MSPTHDAEKTLRTFRKRRSTPACYPCFKRKVKCRGGQPCESCMERGHPEICHVEELSKGSRRHPKGKTQHLSRVQSKGSNGSEPNVGELSAISFVQNSLETPNKKDAFHVMGMRSAGFPISLVTLGKTAEDIDDQVPLRAEILQYYSAFRDLVMPLYPIVPDPLSLETWVAEFLQDRRNPLDSGKLAMILSCLALGAQFTEAQVDKRWEISQTFISRASAYLQKANCIFEPSTEVVQSLLMIGIGLQNLGLSHGAWNLLGLTYRCAQSLGLHQRPDDEKDAMLWTAITWQDALMSLRYDRAPLTTDEQEDRANHSLPPYYDMIDRMCQSSRKLLRQPTTWRHDPHNISSRVTDLEHTVTTAPEHLNLRYTARTLQQKFQYYAFRVHSSMLIAEFCRPSFSNFDTENDAAHKSIRQKGMHHFIVVVESFLELCTFSNVPLRLWSLTQAAVGCALVLALIGSRFPCAKAQKLLRKMVEVLRMSNASDCIGVVPSNAAIPEIYGMHGKSATLLEFILNRKNKATACDSEKQLLPIAVQDDPEEIGTEDDFADLEFNDFLNWPELSLFDNAFSDSLFQANMDENLHDASK